MMHSSSKDVLYRQAVYDVYGVDDNVSDAATQLHGDSNASSTPPDNSSSSSTVYDVVCTSVVGGAAAAPWKDSYDSPYDLLLSLGDTTKRVSGGAATAAAATAAATKVVAASPPAPPAAAAPAPAPPATMPTAVAAPASSPAPHRDWNAEFQLLVERPAVNPHEHRQRAADIKALQAAFAAACAPIVKTLVRERNLPREQRTMPALDVGGIAGGTKVRC